MSALSALAISANGAAALSGIGSPLPRAPEHGDAIYLDYAATTPVWPEVAEAATPYLRLHWGNPSSGHVFGRSCAADVGKARSAVAQLIGASDDEIMFVSCGSEADNHAIAGACEAEWARRGQANERTSALPHVVTTNIEHPAVTACIEALEKAGRLAATYVPVDAEGRVSAAAVAGAVTAQTFLVTVMHSNNEVGAVQPIAAIAKAVRAVRPAVLVHTDAAQSVGKLPVHVSELGVDMLTVVGHKLGAPKGVGALYVKAGLRLPIHLHGGGQEGGRRAGTECVVLITALGEACRIAHAELPALGAHMRKTRDRLATLLTDGLGADRVRLNGPADDDWRLPNTLSIGLRAVRAAPLLGALAEKVAASAGAACHSQSSEGGTVSAVLSAMGVPREYGLGTLRLSTGRHTTNDEVERAAALIVAEARRQLAGGA